MGDNSKIEWCDASWNPTRGCSLVSPGCTNCYAMKVAHRFSGEGKPYEGLTRISGGRPKWTGDVRLVPEKLDQPLRWRRPRRIFVDSMSDLFHEDVPDEYIDQVLAVTTQAAHHTYQILTKRPERALAYFTEPRGGFYARQRIGLAALQLLMDNPDMMARARRSPQSALFTAADGDEGEPIDWPLPNVWLGTSVEDQPRADERIPHLLRTPAAVRFLSCEPLLGPINLKRIRVTPSISAHVLAGKETVDWVIAGGESGSNARPCDVAWLRSIRDQCAAAGVPFFLKQLGARPITRNDDGFSDDGCDGGWPGHPDIEDVPGYFGWQGDPVRVRLRDSHGGDPSEWPEDLRDCRAFPEPARV